jgi:hypothetical protein
MGYVKVKFNPAICTQSPRNVNGILSSISSELLGIVHPIHGMPNHVTPLADHPQLEIITTQLAIGTQDQVTEYRVYNPGRWSNGTIVRGDGSGWIDWLWLVGLVLASRWMRWDLSEVRLFAVSLRDVSPPYSRLP